MFYGAPVTAPMEIPAKVYRSPNAPPMPELAALPAIEDAKVTGYFFTTYDEASRILELAKSSADKAIKEAKAEGKPKEEIGINVSPLFRLFLN